MNFNGRTVLITGASSGIGAAVAVLFAKEGANVALVGRNEDKLKKVAKACEQAGAMTLFIKADVTKDEETKGVIRKTIDKFGKLDVLINSAGVLRAADIVDNNYMESYDLMMSTNMRAVALATNLAAPHIIKSKGNIVNISSVGGFSVNEHFTGYNSSKAALNHFTKCVALELAPHGVRVNAICPGPVLTNIFNEAGVTRSVLEGMTALGKVSGIEEITDLILYFASDKAKSITGSNFMIDNGFYLK